MSHIFISYSRRDLDFAQKIVDALAASNLDTWIDWKSIPKGEDWEDEIYRGIEGADAFLFLISPDSVASAMCNKEIDHAVKNGKRILPIVVRDADRKIVHPEINKRNWIFCREGQDDFNKAIEETRKTIHTDYAWLKYHTELQLKALKWEQKKDASRLLRGRDLHDSERKLAPDLKHDPPPTPQQLWYLKKSRQHANRVRRNVVTTSVVILMTIVLLWLLASRQQRIALARQLAIQSQSINTTTNSKQMIATLLAIQSMKISPTGDAASFLLNNNKSVTSSKCTNYGATSIAFNSDGKYVVLGDIGIVRVLEVISGMEVAHKTYHGNSGVAVAYSPDGRYIASGSRDGIAQVWEVSSGAEIARVTYEYGVNNVAFSPDGKYFVSGGYELLDGIYSRSVAKVWSIASGVEISRMIADGYGGVVDLDFSPDGKNIISVSGNTARVWEAASGKEISHLSGDNIAPVEFSPDGVIVASGKIVWDAASGMEIFRMGDDVSAVAFSPDGAYLVSGSRDGAARVWEVASGMEIARVTHDDAVNDVAFDPNGKYVISGGQDGVARVWDAFSGVEVARMTHDGDVLSVAFSPDGKQAVSGGLNDTTCIWELDGGMEIARMTHDDGISALAFNADGEHVIVISGTAAHVWDIVKDSEISRINLPIDDLVAGSLSAEGSYFVSGSRDGTVRVWEIASGMEVIRGPHSGGVSAVNFSHDGKLVASGSLDGTIIIWETTGGLEIARLSHERVLAVAVSPDARYLASGSNKLSGDGFENGDNTVRVWEISSGEEVSRTTYEFWVNSVGFSPDGAKVVSGGDDGIVRVWMANSGAEVVSMVHDGGVNAVVFSPDGKYIASGSLDGTARVWEVASGTEVARMIHNSSVSALAFSTDGKYVVSGSSDSTVRVWAWQPDDLIARACATMPRNLSQVEWQQYIGDTLPYQAICPNLPLESIP